jgi:Zn-dependent protease
MGSMYPLEEVTMFRNPIEILLSLPAVFLAMSFHEFAHAWTADRLGDPTPRKNGRLTLDPLVHVDWIGLILFTLFGYGWAKPVTVNPSNFRNKRWGDIIVSLAGPLANFLLAIAAAVVYAVLIGLSSSSKAMDTILSVVDYIIYLNIIFFLLNLIPIPPFDGYRVVKDLLFRGNIRFFMKYEQVSIFILFAFVLLGIFDLIISRPAFLIYRSLVAFGLGLLSLFQ